MESLLRWHGIPRGGVPILNSFSFVTVLLLGFDCLTFSPVLLLLVRPRSKTKVMHRGRLCRRRQVFQIDPAQAADRNQAELIQVDFQAFALARLDDTLFTLDITSQVKIWCVSAST